MHHGTAKAPARSWHEHEALDDDVCLRLILLDDSGFDAELLAERLRRDGLRHTPVPGRYRGGIPARAGTNL
jgi:hypothetical protein